MTEFINPEIAGFGGTVFISYARADDERPPFDDTVQGWITFFWHQLRFELTNAGVQQADLWLDRYEIEPSEDFTQKIESALNQARVAILVLSPNWALRPWCLKEAIYFAERNPDAANKTVIVKKRELPSTIKLPDKVLTLVENWEGYKFFDRQPSGEVKEFYWRGLQDQKAYYGVLKKIALWIADRLFASPPISPTPSPTGKVIYVAAPADELRDAWQRLANDLEGSGYQVLPAEDRLPDTVQAVESTVRDALAKAVLSVHLLGDSEGVKPDGSDETVTRLQLRLARERASQGTSFTRILWAPKWLSVGSREKRDPFQVVARFGGLQPGEEVYAEEVTDLSQWLRDRLDRDGRKDKQETWADNDTDSSLASVRTLLVASAHPDDDELAASLANCLQSPQTKTHLLCAGDPIVPGDPAAIVVWGKADHVAIFSLLAELDPVKPIVLRIPGGDEAAKRRFFRDGVYSQWIQSLPSDRKAGRDLLAELGLVPGVRGGDA